MIWVDEEIHLKPGIQLELKNILKHGNFTIFLKNSFFFLMKSSINGW